MTGLSTNPAVSLVIIYCKGREKQFEQTLLSIERQKYKPLEIVVVEDGDDGGVAASLCTRFGARHLRFPRSSAPVDSGRSQYWTANPPFGNLPVQRNRGIKACSYDILMWHDSEVKHDNNVIEELARSVERDPKLLVSAMMQNEDGKGGVRWNRHPSLNEPNSASISSVNAIQRKSLLDIGGFEELFNGYGSDDDFSFFMWRRNFKVEYSHEASATHQWHEGVPFDYPTGRANRAIFFRLRHEIEKGLRPPMANYNSSDVLDSAFSTMNREMLNTIVRKIAGGNCIPEFKEWANRWIADVEDEHGDVAREMEELLAKKERDGLEVAVPWAVASAAFMVRCAENAISCGALASVKHLTDWARTAATIAERGYR